MSRRWATGRTEAFSDGVFAIAITLLVLDVQVPPGAFHDLWRGIAHEWPSYLAYATSFITIGAIWLAHHGMFGHLRYVNDRVMRLNLLLLMAVSFLPFPTRLVGDAIRNKGAERAAVVFYGAILFAIFVTLAALWRAVLRDRELLNRDVREATVDAISRASAPSLGLFLGLTAFAFVAPRVAAFGYLVIAILSVARARGDEEIGQPAA